LLIAWPVLTTRSFAQRRRPDSAPKIVATRLMVQGNYEEVFQGTSANGNSTGKFEIKFEAARWFRMDTNEVGNAEFTELENAPARFANGAITYHGQTDSATPDLTFHADSTFTGKIGLDDIQLSAPGYSDTGTGLKMRIQIKMNLKGSCALVAVRHGERSTSTDCSNGTVFINSPSGLQVTENDDPARSADAANKLAGVLEFEIEPAVGSPGEITGTSGVDQAARARRELEQTMGAGGDAGVYAWRGAVTTGSKEAGFKIVLEGTKEIPSADGNAKSVRKLSLNATIIPGIPK